MTFRTVSGAIEISTSGFRVARLKVGNIHLPAASAQTFHLGFLVVNKCDNRGERVVVEIEGGPPFAQGSGGHQGSDLVPFKPLRDGGGPRRVGPVFTAGSVATVTEPALRCKTGLPRLHLFRGIGL